MLVVCGEPHRGRWVVLGLFYFFFFPDFNVLCKFLSAKYLSCVGGVNGEEISLTCVGYWLLESEGHVPSGEVGQALFLRG